MPSKNNFERFLAATRPVGEGSETEIAIRELGWSPLIVNTVQLTPRNESELYNDFRAILTDGPIEWLVFMSQEGVDSLFKLLKTHTSVLPSMMGNTTIVAVGPKTKTALEKWGVTNAVMPDQYSSQGVSNLLLGAHAAKKHVVLARSTGANDELSNSLTRHGAIVSTLHVYSSTLPTSNSTVASLVSNLKLGTVDGLLFTSAQSATNLFRIAKTIEVEDLTKLLRGCLIGAIGPLTGGRLRELGISPDVQPDRFLIDEALQLMANGLQYRTISAPDITAF